MYGAPASTLQNLNFKHSIFRRIVCFTFFYRATFDAQVLWIWMFGLQPCWFEKNTSFDIASNCRDKDLAMVSSIYISVIPPWLRLWIETTYEKNIHNLGNKNMKKHDEKHQNQVSQLWGKQTRTGPQPPSRYLLLTDEVDETISKISKLFCTDSPIRVEGRWRILFYQTAALSRDLWTSICQICHGTKRSWETGTGRPGDLLGGWYRTRINEKV